MAIDKTVQEQLAFDVAFALGHRSPIKLKLSEDQRRTVAIAVVEQLSLANWRFERGPMAPMETYAHPPRGSEK